MNGINGMTLGDRNMFNNNNLSLPIISSPLQQNGNGRNDNLYLYNNSQSKTPFSQRRTETPNDQSSSSSSVSVSTTNYIMSEIKSMKQLIKATYESQTEMQGKIIEYNRIISQQENIIRLNNIKLSEHDNKLTDILLSFDNYLKLHDKTTKIVNEVQRRLDNTVSISDYSEFKSNYYSNKAIVDNQIASLYHTNEETQMKVIEKTKESKTLQEYIIDKVNGVESQLTHALLDYQRNQIKIQETKDQSTNGQFNNIAALIQKVESHLNEEVKYRKSILENFKGEIIGLFNQFDDKFGRLEKSQLETERNLIYLNKDYVGTFQELMTNQKEKNDIELSSLRSLVDAGLTKNKLHFEENMTVMKERISKLSSGIEEQRTTYADLEVFVKDSVKGVTERVDNAQRSEMETKLKLDTLNKAINTYIKETMENMTKMQYDANEEIKAKLHKELSALELKTQLQYEQHDKGINDLNERHTQISNVLQVLSKVNKSKDDDDEYIDINEVNSFKKSNVKQEDYQQKLIDLEVNMKNDIKTKTDEVIMKNAANTKMLLDSINDRFDKIIEVLKSDLKKDNEALKSTIEGDLQGLIIETEHRINETFNKEILMLQEAFETLTLKYSNRNIE